MPPPPWHFLSFRVRRRIPGDDRGSSFLEAGGLTLLAGSIILSISQTNVGDTIHDSVRDMVCLVEGPECNGETWTEHDRPEEPEQFSFGGYTGNTGGDNEENKALGMKMAAERGFTGKEWKCLETLWHHESNWNHTATNPSGGAHGIPQLHPGAHTPPPGYRNNAPVQIDWGLDYIEDRYGTPCAAWAFWQNPTDGPGFSDNWY